MEDTEKMILCAKLEPSKVKNADGSYEIARTTMLVGDGIYNGKLFPTDEIEKSHMKWEGKPVILNHDDHDVGQVVGYIKDIRMEGNKLTGQPVLDPITKGYETAKGFIQSRFNAGDTPNVSVGMWVDNTIENEQLVARNHRPDHLGIVLNGACSPEDGCGVGLKKDESIQTTMFFNDVPVWTGELFDIGGYVGSTEDCDSSDDKEREKLKKEILKERIKKEELNDR